MRERMVAWPVEVTTHEVDVVLHRVGVVERDRG